MKLKMIRSSLVIAAAITAMSTSAMAQNAPVQLNDAELDEITAGRITALALFVIAPTHRSVERIDVERGRLLCINCSLIDPAQFPKGKSAYGFLFIDRDGVPLPPISFGKAPVTLP